MNTAARSLNESTLTGIHFRDFLSFHYVSIVLLTLLLFISASSVIYIKDLNRRLFYNLQTLEQSRDDLKVAHNQLLLEQNTWATPARIQQIAHDRLVMDTPRAQVVITTMA